MENRKEQIENHDKEASNSNKDIGFILYVIANMSNKTKKNKKTNKKIT